MAGGSSVLPLVIPTVAGGELIQALIEVIEVSAQEGLGCPVFSRHLLWVLQSIRDREYGLALWRLVRWSIVGNVGSVSREN
ncbi:hypothetical protein E4U61_007644 [Claviceps capensis]|nr:hypothetical protein E4U61_007644 [Claviceps capensis]